MKRAALYLNLLLCGWLAAPAVWPCTTFVLQGDGRIYFGRNLDWFWESGLIIVNQRQIQKTALANLGSTPVKWTSKYGSVTFNQFGREMPFGGMNEAGLVVENMWLDETRYPTADARPAINLLQWIQYQLDTCRTVAEVMATDEKIRVDTPPVQAAIHYLVCDATGDCASIELLDGKMVCHRGATLPCRALANDTYDKSVAYARAHPEAEGVSAVLQDPSSLARFTRAATRVTGYKPSAPKQEVTYAFDTLQQVCQGDFTVWRIVYDVAARQIHFRSRSHPEARAIKFSDLNFSPSGPVQFADLQAKTTEAGALKFQDLTEARHRQYLQAFIAQDDLKKRLGDLSLLMEAQLLALKSYTPIGGDSKTETGN